MKQTEIQKTYPMARFYVPEGMYSIGEIEELLVLCKNAKEWQDKALKMSMTKINTENMK